MQDRRDSLGRPPRAAHRRVTLATRVAAALLGSALWLPVTASADFGFQSPSGRIKCAANAQLAAISCSAPRAERGSCDGQPFAWASVKQGGQAEIRPYGCYGGIPVFPYGGRTVQYGATVRAFGIRCRSTTRGITCRNRPGHGFTISRTRLRRS